MNPKIPTIQVVNSGGALLDDPGGQSVGTGFSSTAAVGWADLAANFGAGYSVFDLYEDGAPMANGRTFMATCFASDVIAQFVTLGGLNGPIESVPYRFGSMNIPITYTRDDDVATCFYNIPDPSTGFAAFFKGKFLICEPQITLAYLPPYMVPVFVDAADLVGTVLASLGIDSSLYAWTLASDTRAPNGIVVGPYRSSLTVAPGQSVLNERQSLISYGLFPLVSQGEMFPGIGRLAVETGSFRSATFPTPGAADLQCYRRTDAHGTYTWPGKWWI